jgi:hypothetical protein
MNSLRVLRLCNPYVNNIFRINKSFNKVVIRSLLSHSYSCELQWDNRLKNELLMKISAGFITFYHFFYNFVPILSIINLFFQF